MGGFGNLNICTSVTTAKPLATITPDEQASRCRPTMSRTCQGNESCKNLASLKCSFDCCGKCCRENLGKAANDSACKARCATKTKKKTATTGIKKPLSQVSANVIAAPVNKLFKPITTEAAATAVSNTSSKSTTSHTQPCQGEDGCIRKASLKCSFGCCGTCCRGNLGTAATGHTCKSRFHAVAKKIVKKQPLSQVNAKKAVNKSQQKQGIATKVDELVKATTDKTLPPQCQGGIGCIRKASLKCSFGCCGNCCRANLGRTANEMSGTTIISCKVKKHTLAVNDDNKQAEKKKDLSSIQDEKAVIHVSATVCDDIFVAETTKRRNVTVRGQALCSFGRSLDFRGGHPLVGRKTRFKPANMMSSWFTGSGVESNHPC